MVELQDAQFISDEIDDFEKRLSPKQERGFCMLSREQSVKLTNTEGYRKYKK